MTHPMEGKEYAGWRRLLADSLAALATGEDPGWTKVRLRDWGGAGENYRLCALETVWHFPPHAKTRGDYTFVPDPDLASLAITLRTAAPSPIPVPGHPGRIYALGVSDHETEYNGVYVLFGLEDLLAATLASDTGVLVRHEREVVHLDFHYQGKPVSAQNLRALAPSA